MITSENPNVVYMIVEQEASIFDWKGIRVYLKMKEHVTSGQQLDTYKNQAAKIIGEQTADMIKVLSTFEVTEARPLVDFGQVWEKSV
jgi:hypothetical protein